MKDLPIACSLRPGERQRRADDLLPGLAKTAARCGPIAAGYRFEFAPSRDILFAIAAVIDAERLCCRFLRFELIVEPDEGPVRLDVTGPAGTEEFLGDVVSALR